MFDDAPDLRQKTYIEHPIRRVEHQHVNRLELDRGSLDQIVQAARRCHQDIDAAAQRPCLLLEALPAYYRSGTKPARSAIGLRVLLDLKSKLSRRRQYKRAGCAWTVQPLNDREEKGQRLARTRFRGRQKVTSRKRVRYRLSLNLRWSGDA